jgi:hypothetical protein
MIFVSPRTAQPVHFLNCPKAVALQSSLININEHKKHRKYEHLQPLPKWNVPSYLISRACAVANTMGGLLSETHRTLGRFEDARTLAEDVLVIQVEFHRKKHDVGEICRGSEGDFYKTGIKGFTRMKNKCISKDDHYFEAYPRF